MLEHVNCRSFSPQLVTLRNFRASPMLEVLAGCNTHVSWLTHRHLQSCVCRRQAAGLLRVSREISGGPLRPDSGESRRGSLAKAQSADAASPLQENSGAASNSSSLPQSTPPVEPQGSLTGLKPFHVAAFAAILASGLAFLAVLLYITADIQFQRACVKVLKRLLKTVAIRQVMGILAAMSFVRFGLEPLVKVLRRVFSAQGSWEKSSEYYILREVSAKHFALSCKAVFAVSLLETSTHLILHATGLQASGVSVLSRSIHNTGGELSATIDIPA